MTVFLILYSGIICIVGYWVFKDLKADKTRGITKFALVVGLAAVWPLYILCLVIGEILVRKEWSSRQ